ncbi:MAG: hypothetical protein US50_C0056G0001 [Candidatus Nomurabacteria bacterium GW2011_GWB1_37_5]|uniref:Uncharacterized protein n=1 Tax=Candidatus Nomurabacteria bacterium GW2011_GWB1_37_5 TaxID=1618742 RepID=A0A0G0GT48_9BACT|nr:MAG: hypothetical protein US50_C0056G0001 [Candidatus Nomurabacteria bacterium GW2011_GWB1_37_5]
MTITIISIAVLTLLVWSFRRITELKICPICAGVALTWLWLLAGMLAGKLSVISYQLPIAILMGGTVVGAMSKLEQFIRPNLVLVWKTFFVLFGFYAVWSLLSSNWLMFSVVIILGTTSTLTLIKREKKLGSEQVKELKEKMSNCC